MRKKISHRPYLTTLIIGGAFTLFEILFYARTVFANQPILLLADDSFAPVMQIIQLASVIITFVGFAAGFVWYVVKGKSSEQQKANIQQLKESNDDLRARNSDLRLEKAELEAEKIQLEKVNEDLRKANLRLQGVAEK